MPDISRGDLVMIVRTCCPGSSKLIGIPFGVDSVGTDVGLVCVICGTHFPAGTRLVRSTRPIPDPYNPGKPFWCAMESWLQKLDGPRAKADCETNKPIEGTPA